MHVEPHIHTTSNPSARRLADGSADGPASSARALRAPRSQRLRDHVRFLTLASPGGDHRRAARLGRRSRLGRWVLLAVALRRVGLHDLVQSRHAIRRNYPILAHIRFFLEYVRPEIRQYLLEDDVTAAPFSRNQRSIVYQRAKQQIDKRPFGTQLDVYEEGLRVDQPFDLAQARSPTATSA